MGNMIRFIRPEMVSSFWARLAVSIMRRKWRYVAVVTALLLAAAIPVGWLQLTPGATAGIPQSPQSVRGLRVLEAALGPGAIAPAEALIDSGRAGGVRDPAIQAAIARLIGEARRDREVSATYYVPGGRFVDPSARYAQVIVATRHEYGSEEAQDFARRLRSRLIPAAGFPAGTVVRASTSSRGRTAPSRGSCSVCSRSPTCCSCARSAPCCCR